ncbi:MlaD family protein [Actinocorallia populi]|uniref:MlaD family protein n=1 Tax=Actinocorallia populi TaxID=2079200 RepID=UPI000D091B5E|nr:MlaD family protein [Actinocorallia populi]
MALKSFRDRPPILVGLVSLLVIGLVLTTVFLTGTMGLLKNRYEMSGIFTDTGGLKDGNDVLVAGVLVGEVTSVEPDFEAGHVLVRWKVDHGIELGPQTRAEIRMVNILGGRYIRLAGPVPDKGPYMEDLSEAERRIPVGRTQIPITVNDALKDGATAIKGLDAKTFAKVLDQLDGLSDESKKQLAHAVGRLVEIAEELNNSDAKVSELLDNSDRIIKTVQDKDASLSRLVNNAMTLIDTLRRRKTQLTLLLGSGSAAVNEVDRLIKNQQKQLNGIISDLQGTMKALDPKVDDLNTALAWAGPAMTGFSNIGNYGNYADVIFTQLGQLNGTDLAKLSGMLKGAKK